MASALAPRATNPPRLVATLSSTPRSAAAVSIGTSQAQSQTSRAGPSSAATSAKAPQNAPAWATIESSATRPLTACAAVSRTSFAVSVTDLSTSGAPIDLAMALSSAFSGGVSEPTKVSAVAFQISTPESGVRTASRCRAWACVTAVWARAASAWAAIRSR